MASLTGFGKCYVKFRIAGLKCFLCQSELYPTCPYSLLFQAHAISYIARNTVLSLIA